MTLETQPRECPPFTDEYHSARKAYGLASALLLAWEFIGIKIDTTPIESINITLNKPEVLPYVLAFLTVYFSFRYAIEWFQMDPQRRVQRPSQIDFLAAQLLGFAALIVFSIQQWMNIQLVDYIATTAGDALIMGFLVSYAIDILAGMMFLTKKLTVHIAVAVTVSLALVFVLLKMIQYSGWGAAVSFLGGLTLGGITTTFLWFTAYSRAE